MTEDDRIAELFRTAASEAGVPPAGFDHRDVVAVSRRITARRRSAVVGGAVALLFVAGVGTVAVLPRSDSSTMTTASAGANADNNAAAAPQAAAGAPEAAAGGVDSAGGAAAAGGTQSGGAESGPGAAASAGRSAGVAPGGSANGAAPAPSGSGGTGSGGALTPGGAGSGGSAGSQVPGAGTPAHPLGPGTTTCANRQDPALRALVVAVLPEAANAPGAATSDICLPGTQRYLNLELGGGVLTVAYLPPGTTASLSPGASSAATASHGTVIVSPAPGYANRVPKLLQYLSPRL
jgi:hypothetical protein